MMVEERIAICKAIKESCDVCGYDANAANQDYKINITDKIIS